MKNIKPLKFEIDPRWKDETYYAVTPFCRYCITKIPNKTYKQGFAWQIMFSIGRSILKKELKDAFKVAQKDWVDRMNKIDECYE